MRALRAVAVAVPVMFLAGCGGGGMDGPSGGGTLLVQDVVVGTGATAVAGDTLTVHYVGTFTNGSKFDSSVDANQPYTFRLGTGAVIAGWDQGVAGMRVGGKRRLTIPPDLAYGSQGRGVIPPNTTLLFEIDLLSIAGK